MNELRHFHHRHWLGCSVRNAGHLVKLSVEFPLCWRTNLVSYNHRLKSLRQIKCDVENLKPGRNPVWYRKPRFCKRRVWMQVKAKNSRELKRYVSQNISSNFWNSTVNNVSVLATFVFSQALLYLCNWQIALVIKRFSRKCDKVCFPLAERRFIYTRRKQRLKIIWYPSEALWTSLMLNSIGNSLFHSLQRSRALNFIVDRFQTNNTLIYSHGLSHNVAWYKHLFWFKVQFLSIAFVSCSVIWHS